MPDQLPAMLLYGADINPSLCVHGLFVANEVDNPWLRGRLFIIHRQQRPQTQLFTLELDRQEAAVQWQLQGLLVGDGQSILEYNHVSGVVMNQR